MKKVVKKEEWTRSWSTKYPIVFLEAFADGYTKYAKKYFGRSFFQPIIFEYTKGVATVYRKDKEILKMQKRFADFILKDKKFIEKNIKKMFYFFDKINKFENTKVFISSKNIQSLFNLIAESLALYIMMIWAPDGIKQSDLSDLQKEKFIDQCIDARKKTEHFYPNLVNKFESILMSLDKTKNLNLGENIFASSLNELKGIIKNKNEFSKSELSKRFQYSVFIKEGRVKKIIYQEKAKRFINELIPVEKNIKEVRGVVAMKGKVSGIVKILLRDEDLLKFTGGNENMILVSTMTRPEWIHVMHRSKAYVTDAGGMLCHAAIVARELKKPCIIGTKIATKVLKDGDLVEVDANKGIVKILKRNE